MGGGHDHMNTTTPVLTVGVATDVGRVRSLNEDSARSEGTVFVVADGMGGHAAGEVASRLAAEAVVELQRASYRIEADLLGARTLPALKESPRRLRKTREHFLGAYEGERLVGAISWKRTGSLVDIHRLVVHPERFRRGIARAIIQALEERQPDARRWVVATGAATTRRRAGFMSGTASGPFRSSSSTARSRS